MNKKNQNGKITGVKGLDQLEEMRAQVVEQELSARSWKAYWEKMYYTLESEKIEAEYQACQQRMKEKAEKQREEFERFKQALALEIEKKNQEDPNGQLAVEGITESEPETINEN